MLNPILRLGLVAALIVGAFAGGDRFGFRRATDRMEAARAGALEAQREADDAALVVASEDSAHALRADYFARLAEASAYADDRANLETEMARLRRELNNAPADPLCPEPGLTGERLRIAIAATRAANAFAGAASGAGDGAPGAVSP